VSLVGGGGPIGRNGPPTLGSLGEFGLIKTVSAGLPPNAKTLVGIGDDAAVLATPDGRVVATTDFLLEGRHFRRDWSSAADVGHKAAARSLADCAAMGAEPSALLVALAAPPDLPVSWATELAAGLADECARVGASVIGGDTARAASVLLAVTGLGDLAGRDPVLRSGARPGDLVAVAGPLGPAAAGLALLTAGLGPGDRLLAAARALFDRTCSVTRPPSPDTPDALAQEWVLSGGEDHSLVATFPAGTRLPPRWRVIGEVGPSRGVVVDGQPRSGDPGWDHFAGGR
jgi:thiamine-monophosphate kinase